MILLLNIVKHLKDEDEQFLILSEKTQVTIYYNNSLHLSNSLVLNKQ